MANGDKLFCCMLFSLLVAVTGTEIRAQGLEVPTDSSYLDFSKLSRVRVQRAARAGTVNYLITQTEFKKLIATARYLIDQNSLLASNESLMQASLILLDSSRKVLELKYAAEVERTKLFEAAYQTIKETSRAFQIQLDQCAADLERSRREVAKARRQSFLKGAGTGVLLFTVLWLTVSDR